ncbi:VCBS repeat-containing protein [Asanoa sp. WMMD1127]|uniref:FG-GAP repeat domain-containing protein n=1 Tax=Asanoa sp. WMMD1127 TaxID=3016107 RepID=UPI002417AA45|nr:VCBS repeat-containing protein [Asanoa sp. WMMD1127]MDG4826862.1 VCBS repeat-containing protein [Asanoa sp. WMMD1127]
MNRYGAWRATAVVAAVVTGVAALPAMASAATFYQLRYLDTGPHTDSVAAADVTGDGRPDIVVGVGAASNEETSSLLVYAQQPNLGYGAPRRIVAHGGWGLDVRVAVGDIDGDGRTDAALATPAGVDVFHQRAGQLTDPTLVAAGHPAADVALSDVDGDRRTDLVVSRMPGTVAVHRQTASGAFGAPVTLTGPDAGSVPGQQVFAADFNGDGRPDVAQVTGAGAWVRTQLTGGSFAAATSHLVAPNADGYRWPVGGAAVGDVTGDGRTDLVLATDANISNSRLNVFAGRAGGLPTGPAVVPAYDGATSLAVGDMTGDGRNDVVAAHSGWKTVSVTPQLADGTLGVYRRVPVTNTVRAVDGVAVAYLNGDGRRDIVSIGYEAVAVLTTVSGSPGGSA